MDAARCAIMNPRPIRNYSLYALVLLAIAPVPAIGCSSDPEPSGPPCLRGAGPCRSRDNVSRTVDADSSGKVKTTAKEVWPDLATQPALPPPTDLARACVKLASCNVVPLASCLNPLPTEENGVPFGTTNERVLFLVQRALETGVDCAALKALSTPRPAQIACESHGCEWVSQTDPLPAVSCKGTIATIVSRSQTSERDCSHAFAQCDPQSPTGCTDRPLIKCPTNAADSCDGDVQLGCRMIGFVSLRNCALYGGRCAPTGMSGNATCVYDKTCPLTAPTCTGSTLRVCTAGESVDVDCKALGFASCTAGSCK